MRTFSAMEPKKIDKMLSQTLTDRKLSRGERQAMRQVLEELKSSPDESAFIRSRAFELARNEMSGNRDREVIAWLGDVVGLIASVESSRQSPLEASAYFTDQHDCPAKIVSLISQAEKSIDVCMYTITDDRISKALLDAHSGGVAVRIVTDDEKIDVPGSDIAAFMCAGIAVRTDSSSAYMHNKFAIFDDRAVATGSYNWTAGAARVNQENFIVTRDAGLVREFGKYFERLWQQFA